MPQRSLTGDSFSSLLNGKIVNISSIEFTHTKLLIFRAGGMAVVVMLHEDVALKAETDTRGEAS